MTRSVLCAIGLFFIGISLYVVHHPTGDLASFMNPTTHWSNIRIIAGAGLLAFGLLDVLRQPVIRLAVGVAAVGALLISLFSLVTIYILAIDVFCLMVGGIFGLVASLELTTKHPLHLPRLAWRTPETPALNLDVTQRRSIA